MMVVTKVTTIGCFLIHPPGHHRKMEIIQLTWIPAWKNYWAQYASAATQIQNLRHQVRKSKSKRSLPPRENQKKQKKEKGKI